MNWALTALPARCRHAIASSERGFLDFQIVDQAGAAETRRSQNHQAGVVNGRQL